MCRNKTANVISTVAGTIIKYNKVSFNINNVNCTANEVCLQLQSNVQLGHTARIHGSHLQLGWTTVRRYEMTSCYSQSSVKLKTYQLLISGIFHIIFWPWLTVGNWDWATRDHRHRQTSLTVLRTQIKDSLLTLCCSLPPRSQISSLSSQPPWAAMACAPALPDGPRCQRLHCHKTEQASLSKQHSGRRYEALGKTTFCSLRFSTCSFSSSAGLPFVSAVTGLTWSRFRASLYSTFLGDKTQPPISDPALTTQIYITRSERSSQTHSCVSSWTFQREFRLNWWFSSSQPAPPLGLATSSTWPWRSENEELSLIYTSPITIHHQVLLTLSPAFLTHPHFSVLLEVRSHVAQATLSSLAPVSLPCLLSTGSYAQGTTSS